MIGNYTAPYTNNPNIQGAVLPYNLANGTGGNTASYEANQMSGGKRRKKSMKRRSMKTRSKKRRSTGKRSKK